MLDAINRRVRESDPEIETPQYHVRGTIACWIRVEANGTISGLEFQPGEFEPSPPGATFARETDTSDDGPDLTAADINTLADHINKTSWKLTRIETDNGDVYYDQ